MISLDKKVWVTEIKILKGLNGNNLIFINQHNIYIYKYLNYKLEKL